MFSAGIPPPYLRRTREGYVDGQGLRVSSNVEAVLHTIESFLTDANFPRASVADAVRRRSYRVGALSPIGTQAASAELAGLLARFYQEQGASSSPFPPLAQTLIAVFDSTPQLSQLDIHKIFRDTLVALEPIGIKLFHALGDDTSLNFGIRFFDRRYIVMGLCPLDFPNPILVFHTTKRSRTA
jgi:FPC/CPF motif-containing protein YcgG